MLITSEFIKTDLYFEDPNWVELINQPWLKYAGYEFAFEISTPFIKNLLLKIPLKNNHKYIVVDTKPMYLYKNQMPCNKGFHTDVTMDPEHDSQSDLHHLIQFGSNSLTMFITDNVNWPDWVTESSGEILTVKFAPINYLIQYDRTGVHAGSRASYSGPRLLVRVTETDVVKPVNRITDDNKHIKFHVKEL